MIMCILAFLMLVRLYDTESLCNYIICATHRPLSLVPVPWKLELDIFVTAENGVSAFLPSKKGGILF
jgi:hypothetical protein